MVNVKTFRPKGFTGKGDKHLTKIKRELKNQLKKFQKTLERDEALKLPGKHVDFLAEVLVEFAEDLHNNIGLWKSYEANNREFFGTPLPLTPSPGDSLEDNTLQAPRVHHFLWLFYQELDPFLVLPPNLTSLSNLATLLADFLNDKFADVPQDSGIKQFLNEPNTYGWNIKEKLVWLGTQSYLFRLSFMEYRQEIGEKMNIRTIDDFICQETTRFSGLGVIDILAATLNISEQQRQDLRSWYERHLALFKVQSQHQRNETIRVINLMNEASYVVKVGGDMLDIFPKGLYLLGSLVPWDGHWYWSGTQESFGRHLSKLQIEEFKQKFLISRPHVVYRYNNKLVQKARDMEKVQYEEFLKFHGKDLVVYPDGQALAEGMYKQFQAYNSSLRKQHNIQKTEPDIDLSVFQQQFQGLKNGVAVFFNPDEGQEMMQEFHTVISGMKKQGKDLNEDEMEAIRALVIEDVISPQFVKRVVQEYGDASIAAAFFIDNDPDGINLNYLLRRYKGVFYRNRYPSISITGI